MEKIAQPNVVGGFFSRKIGTIEDAESMKRMKLRNVKRRFGKDEELLSLEEDEAISEMGLI